jgi:hypothetical protein
MMLDMTIGMILGMAATFDDERFKGVQGKKEG